MITNQADEQPQTDTLRARLAEAEDMLRAIQQGEIDALVVEDASGNRVYTLHSAEEPYRDLVEQMQEGAVVLTPHGDILYSNARFAALVGEPLESVVGSRIDRFVSASDRDEFQEMLAVGSGRRRCRLIRSTENPCDVNLSLTATGVHGDRLNLIVMDLTDLLEAGASRDRAERDSRKKSDFLAMLGHELRTPLGTISSAVGVLDLLYAGGGAAPDGSERRRLRPRSSTKRARASIVRQVGHISRLIDDLLDVERVVSGKIRLERRPLDLAEAVRRALGTFIGNSRLDRRIQIRTEPVWVDADAVRLQQVLANIMTNAVKYTPTGGEIRVELRVEGHDAVFSVEDTGLGISPALLPFIFDMYVQDDRTLECARGGLGIGLTLVRRLVELHDGTIVASSEGEGRGSRFVVRLRQVPPADTTTAAPVPSQHGTKSRRVLLIEDNGDAREMLRMMLQLAGHVVWDAADGLRGLELLKSERPDVGIIDIGLPRMDGYEVAKRIREEPHGRGMLLVALTGFGRTSDAEPASDDGFDYHLVKPVDPERLAHLLRHGVDAPEELAR